MPYTFRCRDCCARLWPDQPAQYVERDIGNPGETADFERFSPHNYAASFRTPNLIIHNELDYRVPPGEGLQLFTALQRRGVPSKLLCFPDEGHFVLKPQNSELWHKTVFEWLAEYLKNEAATLAGDDA